MRHAVLKATAGLIIAGALSGCGDQPGERALSGGVIGAGAGAIIGGAAGAPAAGALIGAGAGAVGGAATSPRQVNLGPAP